MFGGGQTVFLYTNSAYIFCKSGSSCTKIYTQNIRKFRNLRTQLSQLNCVYFEFTKFCNLLTTHQVETTDAQIPIMLKAIGLPDFEYPGSRSETGADTHPSHDLVDRSVLAVSATQDTVSRSV